MLKVIPGRIEIADGNRGVRLVLTDDEARQTYHLDLPLAAGQRLALEMKGLAADRCGEHHVGPAIAQAAGMKLSSLVLTMLNGGCMAAHLVLEQNSPGGQQGPVRVRADVAAALALAIHINLPIFVEERSGVADDLDGGHEAGHGGPAPSSQVPLVFQEVIRSLEWPEQG